MIDNIKNNCYPNTAYPINYSFTGDDGWLYWGSIYSDTKEVQYRSPYYDAKTYKRYKNGNTWLDWATYISDSDLNVSTVDGSVKTTNDWTINFARAKKSGHAVALKIDATAKTASSGWITVASGLPAAADDFFYQGYDDGHGAYKIKIDTSGNLSLSNRSGKVATYVDTVISYIAK